MSERRTKLYAYADEYGQDTQGVLFLVAVVVVSDERDALLDWLEEVERETGKGRVPWHRTRPGARAAYVERVLSDRKMLGALFYASHRVAGAVPYRTLTLDTVADALESRAAGRPYKATVVIDGLRREEVRTVGIELRRRRIPAKKVRGARDESHALVRLADALAGFVRDADEGHREYAALRDRARAAGALWRLPGQEKSPRG
jgi:hypothetical protein